MPQPRRQNPKDRATVPTPDPARSVGADADPAPPAADLVVTAPAADGRKHAARRDAAETLCGLAGSGSTRPVQGAFDVTCPHCQLLVVRLMRLTPLSDPTNVQLRIVEEEQ